MNARKNVLITIDKLVTCSNINDYFDQKDDDFYIAKFNLQTYNLNVSVIKTIKDIEDSSNLMKTIQFIYNTNEEIKDNKIFPFIYRYFKCSNDNRDIMYLVHDNYMSIDVNNLDFIVNLSDWYSFAFQICFIFYYLSLNNVITDKPLQIYDFCVLKLNNSYTYTYNINNKIYNIKCNFLIRLWNPQLLLKFSENSDIFSYFYDEMDKLVPQPPKKIIQLMNKVNYSTKNIPEYLEEIYGPKEF